MERLEHVQPGCAFSLIHACRLSVATLVAVTPVVNVMKMISEAPARPECWNLH